MISDVANTTSTPAFSIATSSGFGSRLLNIDLLVNANASSGSTVEEKAAVEGRNTQYGYDPSACASIPPY